MGVMETPDLHHWQIPSLHSTVSVYPSPGIESCSLSYAQPGRLRNKLHIELKTTTNVKLELRYVQLEVYTFTSSERLEISRFWFLSVYFEIQGKWLLVVVYL